MKVKFWGVRGSLPTPYSEDIIKNKLAGALSLATPADIASTEAIERFLDTLPMSIKGGYGGNSTCIQVKPENGDMIIIDCGSGIKKLGNEMMKDSFGKGNGNGTIFMTHTHWDHIHGIPFFAPFYVPGNKFTIYSPYKDMRERIEYQQVFTHFPVNLDMMMADKEFVHFEPETELILNGLRISNKSMRHPGGSFGYRFEEEGKVFVFTSDCEFNMDEIDKIHQYEEFFKDADVVVFDTQYTFDESINKVDWGHSSASIAIDIASKFNVKKLYLWHHDPEYDDEKLDDVLASAKSYVAINLNRKNIHLDVEIAVEGREIEI